MPTIVENGDENLFRGCKTLGLQEMDHDVFTNLVDKQGLHRVICNL